jgi:hypothetical protein
MANLAKLKAEQGFQASFDSLKNASPSVRRPLTGIKMASAGHPGIAQRELSWTGFLLDSGVEPYAGSGQCRNDAAG